MNFISSPEPKAQVSYSDRAPSVCPFVIFSLNDFSKTTGLIWTKFTRKHLWGMGFQVCENQGAGTHWSSI